MMADARITLTKEGDVWSSVDDATGVASQGATPEEALRNLREAVALHRGDIGEPVTDEDLRELGIAPDDVADEDAVPDAPWFDA